MVINVPESLYESDSDELSGQVISLRRSNDRLKKKVTQLERAIQQLQEEVQSLKSDIKTYENCTDTITKLITGKEVSNIFKETVQATLNNMTRDQGNLMYNEYEDVRKNMKKAIATSLMCTK